MDWQALLIATISSAGLTQAVGLIRETGPKQRKLKRKLLAWEEWAAKLRRWLIRNQVDTDTMPQPPDDSGE